MKDQLHQEFRKLYGKDAEYAYFSPGRVNLVGEHIDYNGGLVMPCAVTFGTYLLVSPNTGNVLRFRSLNFDETLDIPVQTYSKTGQAWFNYPLGIIDYFLRDAGYSKLELVKLSQSVENNFIGVNCGIMDQFAVAFGEKNKALMLNCDTLDYKAVDSNLGDHILAVINTNKPRKLAESKYNERVQECRAALSALQQELDIKNLCDIDTATFNKHAHVITDEIIYK